MKYNETLIIPKNEAERINHYTNDEPQYEEDCLGEDETISYTVPFKNGYEMDIKCCGVQFEEGSSNTAWTEAVLFDKQGREVCCSEPNEGFFGEWELEDKNGNVYVADVKEGNERTKDTDKSKNTKKKPDMER